MRQSRQVIGSPEKLPTINSFRKPSKQNPKKMFIKQNCLSRRRLTVDSFVQVIMLWMLAESQGSHRVRPPVGVIPLIDDCGHHLAGVTS